MTPSRGTDVERIQRTFVQALASETFERHGARRGTWDVSRDCETPVPVTLYSRATGLAKNLSKRGVKPVPGIELTLLTPCRRCPVCLGKKSRLWTYRARAELERAERTWFCTLTTNPDFDFRIDALCATTYGREFLLAPPWEKFRARSVELGKEVTKYLKRIRKNSGCRFRYLVVTEIHDSRKTSAEKRYRPHCHLLLHEFAGQPMRKSMLEAAWPHGYCQFKLATDSEAAWYVSKYISKAADARVRASLDYGM